MSGTKIHEARHTLTTQLIRKLLELKPDDENFTLAHDFCLQKEYYHSFCDVNPSTVESFYADIVQRLREDSQLSKAAALSALTSQLLALNLGCSTTLDLNHNLLQLLASLAGQPLESELQETPQLLQLLYKAAEPLQAAEQPKQAAAVSRFRQLLHGGRAGSAASDNHDETYSTTSSSQDSDGGEYDPFAEESELTSWDSDDEQEHSRQRSAAARAAVVAEQQLASDEEAVGGQASAVQPVPALYRPPGVLQAPQQLQPCRAAPTASQLLVQLASRRLAHLPFLWPDRKYCFTGHFMAQQLLKVLQGQAAHGFVLTLPQGGPGGLLQPCIQRDPRVTVPELSPGALHTLLDEFAAAGSAAWQLRKLAAQLTQSRGRAWLSGGMADTSSTNFSIAGTISVTSCLRSFGVALQQQLDLMGQQVVQLQRKAHMAGTTPATSSRTRPAGPTLLTVKQQMRPIMQRLQLLHGTVSAMLQQLGGCPADTSAALLDGLYEAVNSAAMAACGEQGVADAAALLQLLLCSCVPLVAALAQWLWSAADGADDELPDPAGQAALGRRHSTVQEGGAAANEQQQQQQAQEASCCCEDFFIVKKAAVAATDARFWHAAYGFSIRRDGSACTSSEPAGCGPASSAGGVACPVFLLPLVDRIMTAGKSVRLLDYLQQEELRQTSFCGSTSTSTSKGAVEVAAAIKASGSWLGAAAATAADAVGGRARHLLSRSSSTASRMPGHQRADSSLGKQHSLKAQSSGSLVRQPSGRARRSSTGANHAMAAAVATPSAPPADAAAAKPAGHARKQWSSDAGCDDDAAVSVAAGATASNLTRQVRLQLAVATAVASRSEQEQLPQEFIAAACQLFQRKQQQQQQHAWKVSGASTSPAAPGHTADAPSSASDLMRSVLEAAGRQLAHPCIGQLLWQQQQDRPASLREALLAAKVQRTVNACQAADSTPATVLVRPARQQAQQQPQGQPSAAHQQLMRLQNSSQLDSKHSGGGGHDASSPGPTAAAPAASQSSSAADELEEGPKPAASGAGTSPDVPRLLQWRDQIEAQLAVAGSCLQHMAPWQLQWVQSGKLQRHDQEPQQDASSSSSSDTLARTTRTEDSGRAALDGPVLMSRLAASSVPGSFSSSLAELWPLHQPLLSHCTTASASRRRPGGSSCDAGQQDEQQQQRLAWLAGGQWPCDQLAWLLLQPPRQLLPLPQLLEQALLQPIQERLDLISRQLLSSLMGEWGLLQQLQGVMGVFLLASPTMVEWCEGCFAAVEAAAAAKRLKAGPSSNSSSSSRAMPAHTAGAASSRPAAYEVVLGVDELDVYELELLLHDLVAGAAGGEPLPDTSCLHISLNTAALADLRAAKQKQQAAAAAADGASSQVPLLAASHATLLGVTGAAVTGGLWGCSAEWAGLSCRHSGTWQLSLLYDTEELDRFSMAWRFLLQLRWVRRRIDGARHAACKGPAALLDMDAQDSQEQLAVAAALQAFNRLLGQGRAAEPGGGDGGVLQWLSSRQELLLLQEMGQLMARWQQYVMDRLLRGAAPALEQALCSADSLDQVRDAAASFLATVSNLCNARPSGKGAGGTWRHVGRVLGQLMDTCLAAAAAATRLRELRQQLAQPGIDSMDAQRCWLELSGLRARLSTSAASWRGECGYLLRILSVRSVSLGDEDDLDALLGALDANGYYQRLAGLAGGGSQ